jgi:hypothetical protein
VTSQIPRCATRLALRGLQIIARDAPQRFETDSIAQEFLKTDRSGVFKIVMAGRCGPGRTVENSGTAGSRRMSDAWELERGYGNLHARGKSHLLNNHTLLGNHTGSIRVFDLDPRALVYGRIVTRSCCPTVHTTLYRQPSSLQPGTAI